MRVYWGDGWGKGQRIDGLQVPVRQKNCQPWGTRENKMEGLELVVEEQDT